MTDAEIVALKNEIISDPKTLGLTFTKDNAEIVRLLNDEKYASLAGEIPIADLRLWLVSNKLRSAIETDASDTGSATRDISLTLIDFLQAGSASGSFAVEETLLRPLIDGYVANGIITRAQADGFYALVRRPTSRAKELFGRNISIDDVRKARAR